MEAPFVEQALRQVELAGERQYNYVRLTLIVVGGGLFALASPAQTRAADAIWAVVVLLFSAWSVGLWLYFRRAYRLSPALRYLIAFIDQAFVYSTAFACLANHSGAYEIYRSPVTWTLIAGFNGLSALRYSVGLSLFGAGVTLGLGALELAWLKSAQPDLFIQQSTFVGEGMQVVDCIQAFAFAAFPGVLAAAAAHFGRRLVVEAAHTAIARADAERVASNLREQNEQQQQFLRVASHELRTPITALRLTTQQLLRKPPEARHDELLKRVERQTTRMNRLIEQLLDTARVGLDAVPLQPAPCDLVDICRGGIEAAESAEGRVRLEAEGPVRGRWDALRLEQVVTNLVSNALRYGPPDTPVIVRVSATADRASISVIDRGLGIAPGDQEAIFMPFFRGADAPQTEHRAGFGLGLHIAKQIVVRHGGTIRVESAPGRGSTFVVDLARD